MVIQIKNLKIRSFVRQAYYILPSSFLLHKKVGSSQFLKENPNCPCLISQNKKKGKSVALSKYIN